MKADLIIDGDIVVFQACAASERAIKWDDDLWTLQTDEWEAKHKAHTSIERIIAKAKTYFDIGYVHIAISSTTNFRKEVYPDYKANRINKRKPMCIREVVAYLASKYPVKVWTGIEADDVMGIWATMNPDQEVLIYSADKDMATIPGAWHMRNLDDEPTKINPIEADRNWFTQALTGDSVDNYAGIKGVGPVKAKKILDGAATALEMWERTLKAFVGAGYTQGECLTQVRLARILRQGDYAELTGEVKLWSPEWSRK